VDEEESRRAFWEGQHRLVGRSRSGTNGTRGCGIAASVESGCWSDETDDPDSGQLREDPLPARARIEELPGLRLFDDQDAWRPSSSRRSCMECAERWRCAAEDVAWATGMGGRWSDRSLSKTLKRENPGSQAGVRRCERRCLRFDHRESRGRWFTASSLEEPTWVPQARTSHGDIRRRFGRWCSSCLVVAKDGYIGADPLGVVVGVAGVAYSTR